jgi:hypothetical protein
MSADDLVNTLVDALVQMGLKPSTASFPAHGSALLGTSSAMQWNIEIAPDLIAELTLMRTSGEDHLLQVVTPTDCAHDAQRWADLDLFAREMGKAVRPVQLIRNGAELACFVQGRARGASGLVGLVPELLAMNRYALVTLFEPWVALARGEIDLDTAGLQAGAALARMGGGES